MEQYNHIFQTLLRAFFLDTTPVLFQSSHFPINPAVEMSLFTAIPLTEEENEVITTKYHGSYNHWTGGLLHIGKKSRQDIVYVAMCIL